MALRRDGSSRELAVSALLDALLGAEAVVTTGLVLQELLQGFAGPKAAAAIVERFRALPMIQPERHDHIAAAGAFVHAASHVSFKPWRPKGAA